MATLRRSLNVVALVIAASAVARADDLPNDSEIACSVRLKCSSEGIACVSNDRVCADKALSHGLEVICDRPIRAGVTEFVYCPPLTERGRDSRGMWILLGVACFIAVIGSVLAGVMLKKK